MKTFVIPLCFILAGVIISRFIYYAVGQESFDVKR